MKRFILLVVLSLAGVGAYSQSPVVDLVEKYKQYSGASCVDFSGFKLTLARPALRSSPLAPVASDVERLIVLHMDSVSGPVLDLFEKSLYGTLGSYESFGEQPSPGGPVQVYARFSDSDVVCELVIYNPKLCVLNDIQGEFSMNSLEKLK